MKLSVLTASLLALSALAPAAHAYKQGDLILRAGAALVEPDTESSKISTGVTGKLAGTKATVGNDTQLGLTFTYMVTDHVGVELLAATPFTHRIGVKGVPVPGIDGRFGSAQQLPPTLSVQYFPLDASSKLQPYVGAGVNYTTFFNEKLSDRQHANGFSQLELSDSWGLALQAGVDYQLTDRIVLNAAVWRIDLNTKATAQHSALGKVKVDVDVDPWVYMVGIGYKF